MVAFASEGRVLILDDHLNVRGCFRDSLIGSGTEWQSSVWEVPQQAPVVLLSSGVKRSVFWVETAGILRAQVLAALGRYWPFVDLLLLFEGLIWAPRLMRRRSPRRREALQQTLAHLQQARHGSHSMIAGLATLEDLDERLGYVAADESLRSGFETLIHHNIRTFLESACPHLERTLEAAAAAGLKPQLITETHNALETLRSSIQAIHGSNLSSVVIGRHQPKIASALACLRQNLMTLREAAEELASVAPKPIIEALLARMAEDLRRAGITCRFTDTSAPHPLICMGDQADLLFTFENLFDNAKRAMAERGGGKLQIALTHQGRFACIEVTDSGPGIPAEKHERIFQAGYTSRAHGGGSGLGRSRDMLKAWQGDLNLVWSTPEQGSCFAVQLMLTKRTWESLSGGTHARHEEHHSEEAETVGSGCR